MNEEKKVWAVLAGGGTAGHIFPALAIAKEIESRGLSWHLVTSQRGMESHIPQEFKSRSTALKTSGFQRKLRLSSLSRNIRAASELVFARRKARKLFKELKPDIVLSLGGYAAMPCGLAARSLKIPLVLSEPNAAVGLANKILSRWAKACAVSFRDCQVPNSALVGNPVRPEIVNLDRQKDRERARQKLGITGFLVVVAGGSLGSKKMNKIILESLPELKNFSELNIRHIVGTRDWAWFSEEKDAVAKKLQDDFLWYEAIEFEKNMEDLYAAADLFISRAGAAAIAELAVTGMPSVLIPLPDAAGNHQIANARAFTGTGSAALLEEADLTAGRLIKLIAKYMSEPRLLEEMSRNAKGSSYPRAADSIVDLMEVHSK